MGPPCQHDMGISPGIFGADLALLDDDTHQGLLPNGPSAGLLGALPQVLPMTPSLLPLAAAGADPGEHAGVGLNAMGQVSVKYPDPFSTINAGKDFSRHAVDVSTAITM